MVEDPDLVVTHHPQTCQGCGCCLENVEPQKTIRRQVFDLPSLRLQVTEHQSPKLKYVLTVTLKMKDLFPKTCHTTDTIWATFNKCI